MKMAWPSLQIFLLMRWLRLPALAVAVVTLFGCARTITVTIPPHVELANYPAIGVIEFVSRPPGLGADATKKFINNLHAAQSGVRILELGSQPSVLKDAGYDVLDFKAVKAIGDHYGVAAVITGTVDLTDPQPDVKFSTDLKSLAAGVKAKVDGRMSARLWETASGATTWSNSSWGNWTVGGMSLGSNGSVSAGYHYPREKQDQILAALVRALNGDFWPTYEKRNVEE
ncbi:hypothetical protein [Geobacter sp. AOG1]|uniref:hypothetical protein n=1 Tax=Geobacter sp. AOG1 TaxID=1566346 RepID=UPI001CC555FC|nr:hypothetical protein [Geobacter sp. AOG1]GFE59300.1 hypothetical protein AOG1_31800 [Geobacter sp. AOG1]